MSQDPYSGSNEDPISLHRYLYAGNDPVDIVDPSGQEGELVGTLTAISGQLIIAAQRLAPVFTAFNYIITALDAIQLYQTYQLTGKVDYKQLGFLALDLASLGPLSKLAAANRVASHFLLDVVLDAAPKLRDFGGAAVKAVELFKAEQKLRAAGVTLVKNADAILDAYNAGAGFDGVSKQLFLRSNATSFQLFHEMQHFQHYLEIGDLYNNAEVTTKLIKEEYVYEKIMANANKFNSRILEAASSYVQDWRDGKLF